jgi:hypothetical protein
MNKTKKVAVASMLVTGALLTASVFGVGVKAYAEEGTTTFLSRVAEILGVKEADLETALDTAREEGLRPEGFGRGRGMMGGERGMGMGKESMEEDLAAFLGITEEKVEAELEAGKFPHDLIEEYGKSEEDYRDYRESKREERRNERIENRVREVEES